MTNKYKNVFNKFSHQGNAMQKCHWDFILFQTECPLSRKQRRNAGKAGAGKEMLSAVCGR